VVLGCIASNRIFKEFSVAKGLHLWCHYATRGRRGNNKCALNGTCGLPDWTLYSKLQFVRYTVGGSFVKGGKGTII